MSQKGFTKRRATAAEQIPAVPILLTYLVIEKQGQFRARAVALVADKTGTQHLLTGSSEIASHDGTVLREITRQLANEIDQNLLVADGLGGGLKYQVEQLLSFLEAKLAPGG